MVKQKTKEMQSEIYSIYKHEFSIHRQVMVNFIINFTRYTSIIVNIQVDDYSG